MKKIFAIGCGLVLAFSALAHAQSARLAGEDDIRLFKTDVLLGKIKVGKTRLKQIREAYGDASNISDSGDRLTYNYGDVSVTFDKKKYLIDTEYDYSQPTVYSDSVADLRADLGSGQIVGDFVTATTIRKSYGEPTKAIETDDDGGLTIYYYGEVKLIFENTIVVQNWRGSGLDKAAAKDLLEGKVLGSAKAPEVPAETKVPPAPPVPPVAAETK